MATTADIETDELSLSDRIADADSEIESILSDVHDLCGQVSKLSPDMFSSYAYRFVKTTELQDKLYEQMDKESLQRLIDDTAAKVKPILMEYNQELGERNQRLVSMMIRMVEDKTTKKMELKYTPKIVDLPSGNADHTENGAVLEQDIPGEDDLLDI